MLHTEKQNPKVTGPDRSNFRPKSYLSTGSCLACVCLAWSRSLFVSVANSNAQELDCFDFALKSNFELCGWRCILFTAPAFCWLFQIGPPLLWTVATVCLSRNVNKHSVCFVLAWSRSLYSCLILTVMPIELIALTCTVSWTSVNRWCHHMIGLVGNTVKLPWSISCCTCTMHSAHGIALELTNLCPLRIALCLVQSSLRNSN